LPRASSRPSSACGASAWPLPFVNQALRVELVGLRRWRGLWLGVLVTPWFMNLLLLPGDGAAEGEEVPARWPVVRTGEYAQFAFPAGVMSFLAGREGEVGEYLSCSLFSPVFEFAGHDVARQTAEACLTALFDPAAAGGGRPPRPRRRQPASVSSATSCAVAGIRPPRRPRSRDARPIWQAS